MARKNNKQEVINSASKLLSQYGYTSLNMRSIAKGAGIKAASIYNHFSSKDEIVFLLILEGRTILADMLSQGMERCKNAEEMINSYFDSFIKFGYKYPEFYKIIFMTEYPPDSMENVKSEIAREIEPGLKTLAKLLSDYLNMSESDTMHIGETLFHMTHGHISLSILNRPDFLFNKEKCRQNLQQAISVYLLSLSSGNKLQTK